MKKARNQTCKFWSFRFIWSYYCKIQGCEVTMLFIDTFIYNYCTFIVVKWSLLLIRINSVDDMSNFNWSGDAVTNRSPCFVEKYHKLSIVRCIVMTSIEKYQISCYHCYKWLSVLWFYLYFLCCLIISADNYVFSIVADVFAVSLHLLECLHC